MKFDTLDDSEKIEGGLWPGWSVQGDLVWAPHGGVVCMEIGYDDGFITTDACLRDSQGRVMGKYRSRFETWQINWLGRSSGCVTIPNRDGIMTRYFVNKNVIVRSEPYHKPMKSRHNPGIIHTGYPPAMEEESNQNTPTCRRISSADS